MIRIVLVFIALVIFAIFSIIILPVEWIINRFNPGLRAHSSQAIICFMCRLVCFLSGAKTTITGLENLPKDEPVLYIGNHNSMFDILLTYPLMPTQTGYIAKKEVKKVFGLAQYMLFMNCLFLDRKDPKEGMKMILQAIDYIKSGISLFIFPEGTRSKDGKMNPFKEGSFKIASKTGCKIVPVAMTGTADVFENHLPFLKKSKVTIDFGKPFTISEIPEEFKKFPGQYTQGLIQEMLDSHR